MDGIEEVARSHALGVPELQLAMSICECLPPKITVNGGRDLARAHRKVGWLLHDCARAADWLDEGLPC
jgi:hypothetical protein